MLFGLKKSGFDSIVSKAVSANSAKPVKIVFCDSSEYVLKACLAIKKKGIARPLLVGNLVQLKEELKKFKISSLEDDIIDCSIENENSETFAKEYVELRKLGGKAVSIDDARKKMQEPAFFGAMLVIKDQADALLGGFTQDSKSIISAMEIIGLAPGISRLSTFSLVDGKELMFFSDCVMNPAPNSEQLSEIAQMTGKSAEALGCAPRVALLSFSTRDSSKHDSVERIKLALSLVKRKNPQMIIDGEIQADAALNNEVMKKKCPDSPLEGKANVLIFPDINSANISYKLLEELGGLKIEGPFLQGFRKPFCDLSKAASHDEIIFFSSVAVLQTRVDYALAKEGESRIERVVKTAKREADSEEQLKKLPSNIRKIIEEHRTKSKKEEPKD